MKIKIAITEINKLYDELQSAYNIEALYSDNELEMAKMAVGRIRFILAKAIERMELNFLFTQGTKANRIKKIFSGKHSIKMWDDIKNAETIEDLQSALYFVCYKIQELESKIDNAKN